MLHPDLTAARFIPNFAWGPRFLSVVRRAPLRATKPPAGLTVGDVTVPSAPGAPGVRVKLYRPAVLTAPAPALLWMHGGGYVMGAPEQDDRTCLAVADRLGMTVASVDYRLAPEHPFPAALDDARATLSWLVANASGLSVDPGRIAVGGASAGGGLAAALAQRAVDEGVPPAFQLLVYPMLDDRTVLTGRVPTDLRVWTPGSNRFGWTSYLGRPPGGDTPAYAVPARRPDLAGLPPAWIGVGTEDLFHDEAVAYATRLRAAGVPCELTVVEGAFHGFDAAFPGKPVSRGFLDDELAALGGALACR